MGGGMPPILLLPISLNMQTAQYYINHLNMVHHIEGGAFSEVYRSALILPQQVLTIDHNADRNAMTHIYFLLQAGEFSALHRIASDELWHYYDGDPLDVFEILPDGRLVTHRLGRAEGCTLFCAIAAGSWFGSRVAQGAVYSLVGCTVAPGFDFADFELAEKEVLQQLFPQHSSLIQEMTRP